MTSKRSSSSKPIQSPPNLTIPKVDANNQLSSRIEKGKDLLKTTIQSDEEFEVVQQNYYKWDEYNTELLVRIFDNDQVYQGYRLYSVGLSDGTLSQKIDRLFSDISYHIRRLESIIERLQLIPEPIEKNSQIPTSLNKPNVITKEVFIVHGTDQSVKDALARFLTKLDLVPIILHEQPNLGNTLIEKLERNSTVAYSIVLLTGDDKGYPKNNTFSTKLRARQNVVFELGYFIGKLGRDKVCALYSENVELPSDFHGVVYIPLDQAGAWQIKLAKELKSSGLNIDLNKL